MWRVQQRRIAGSFLPHLKRDRLLESGLVEAGTAGLDPTLIQLLDLLLADEDSVWADRIGEIIRLAAVEAGVELAQHFGLTGSFENFPVARVVEEINTNSLALVRNINTTTRNQIRTIIADGIENHLSYSAVAKLIRDRFIDFGKLQPQAHIRDRATLVAVDAIGQAYTDAQFAIGQAMVETGLSMEKAWQTVGDDRVEEDCESNEAAGWIPWADDFPSGDQAPLAHPGCRCALLMQRSDQ